MKLMRCAQAAIVMSIIGVGCTTGPLYSPRAQEGFAELTEDDARDSILKAFLQSFSVAHQDFETPVISYSGEIIDLQFKARAAGKSNYSCQISLEEALEYKVIDLGNNPRDAQASRKRFSVSKDEQTPLCRSGWPETQVPRKLADALYSLQRGLVFKKRGSMNGTPTSFEKSVETYQKLQKKPELPEEARRFSVLAKNATEEKRYYDSIDHYKKALEIAPWWADGHYQRALLLGQQGLHAEGVIEMKRFLALEPNSPQARNSLDLIYIWEDKITRAQSPAQRPKE